MMHPAIRTLSRLMEGDLGEARRARIERHVAGCARCRVRLDLMEREVAMALKQDETTAGGAALRDHLLAQLPARPAWTRESQPCGEIEAVQGVALIFRNGDAEGIEAFPGMALLRGDSLRVIGKSLVMVRLADGSTLYLNRGSEATFFKGRYDLDLGEGELFAMMERQPRPFRLWTPAATLEVLGTDFDAKVSEDKSQTELSVLKGRVAFENKAGRAVVEKRCQVAAASHSKPAPARLADYSSIGGWAAPLRSRAAEDRRGGALVRWIAVIVIAALAVIGAWAWLSTKPDSGASYPAPKKADVDRALQAVLDSSPNLRPDAKQTAQLREFMTRYILAPGETVRFIPEPYPAGRAIYYPMEKQFNSFQVEPAQILMLKWTDDGRLVMHADFRQAPGVSVNLNNILFSALSIEPQRVRAAPDVPTPPQGDYIVRMSAALDDIIPRIIDVTGEKTGVPLAWEWRTEPQRVLVVGGELKLNVDPVAKAVMLYPGAEPSGRTRPEEIAANPGQYEENTLEFFLGSRLPPLAGSTIVNEVRPPWDQEFRWHYDIPSDFGESPGDRDRLFENIAKQTGLTFTWADRPAQVLHVWRAGDMSAIAATPEIIQSATEPRAAINDATLDKFIERMKEQGSAGGREAMRTFLSQYGLAEGQLVKYVPQPGTPERTEFVRRTVKDTSHPPRPTDPANVSIVFAWVEGGGLNYMNWTSIRHTPGGFSIRDLAQKIWRMDPMAVEGPPEALAARFPGDFIYRPSTNPDDQERLVEDTVQLLRDKAGYRWRATWTETPREIIIATGAWRPNPESKTGSGHPMFLLYSDTFTDGGPGGGADIVSFMQTVGELTGHIVVTKPTGEIPDYPPISYHVTAAPMNLASDRAELRRFLDRLERQTGLTFSLEMRPFRRIILEPLTAK